MQIIETTDLPRFPSIEEIPKVTGTSEHLDSYCNLLGSQWNDCEASKRTKIDLVVLEVARLRAQDQVT
jgi:hypothetical protein